MGKYLLATALGCILIGSYCGGSGHAQVVLRSKHDIILNSISTQAWDLVMKNQVSESDRGYKELLASLLVVEDDKPLSPQALERIIRGANEDPTSYKGLISCMILVTGGRDLSDQTLARMIELANTKSSDGSSKQFVAIKILKMYQRNIRASRTQ